MPNITLQPVTKPATKPRVLRVIAGYALDTWTYRYTSGSRGEDTAHQFCFLPGSFDASLARGGDVTLTQDMNGIPFASLADGTLKLRADEVGLMVHATLIDSPRNRELVRLIDAGRVRGWSHRFEAESDGYEVKPIDGGQLTEIREAELQEITLVVDKYPRQYQRKTPIFIMGGPAKDLRKLRGSCCQNEGSSGITICAEMSRADCIASGGTYLGNGTRCWLEGCGVCDQPGECSTFCDSYLLRFYLEGPVGCVSFLDADYTDIELTREADPTDGCTWFGESPDGFYTFTLAINTATSPPTKTLTVSFMDGENTSTLIASSPAGFCEARSIVLNIDSYVSNFCDSDPPSASSIILTQSEGCPDFLP